MLSWKAADKQLTEHLFNESYKNGKKAVRKLRPCNPKALLKKLTEHRVRALSGVSLVHAHGHIDTHI